MVVRKLTMYVYVSSGSGHRGACDRCVFGLLFLLCVSVNSV